LMKLLGFMQDPWQLSRYSD